MRQAKSFSATVLVMTVLCGWIPFMAFSAAPANVAAVVHSGVKDDNLSLAELRKTLMGEKQFWSSKQRVTLLIRAPVAHERTVLLSRVYQMDEGQFRQYWVAKLFRAEAPSGPKTVNSNATAIDLVERVPGAIAFVDAAEVPRGIKVLKIDNLLPSDRGYPLR